MSRLEALTRAGEPLTLWPDAGVDAAAWAAGHVVADPDPVEGLPGARLKYLRHLCAPPAPRWAAVAI
jgi:hypothetical protein